MALSEVLVNFTANISDVTAKFKQVQDSTAALTAKISKNKADLTKFAAGFAVAGGALAAGLGAAVVKAADFDSAMSKVKALSGATGADFEKLRQTAITLGAQTTYSASEAANGMQVLAAAGLNSNQIVAAMPGLLNTAAAAGEDFASVSDIMVSAMNGFGLQAKDMGHIGDVLASAANASSISIQDMGVSMKYVAPIAHTVGASIEEVSSLLTILGNNGIKADTAGTALRMAMIKMASPTQKSAGWFNKLNLEVQDAKGNFLPMGKIIGELHDKFLHLSQAQQLQAASSIFGTESASAMVTLIHAGGAEVDKYAASFKNADGAAKNMANTMMDNLNGSLEQMRGAMESAAISIGAVLAPTLKKLADYIQGLVNKFNAMSQPMKEFIVVSAVIAAGLMVLTGVVIALGIAVAGLAAVEWTVLAPFLAIAAAIAGVVAIGVILYKNWERIGVAGKTMAAVMFPGITLVVGAIKAFQYATSSALPTVDLFAGKISDGTKKAVGAYMDMSKKAGEQMDSLFWNTDAVSKKTAKELENTFKQMGDQIVNGLKEQENKALDEVQAIMGHNKNVTKKELENTLNLVKKKYTKQIADVEAGEKRIKTILDTAARQHRNVTQKEEQEISDIRNKFQDKAVQALSQSAEEQKTILMNLQNGQKILNEQQASDVITNSAKARDATIKDAKTVHDEKIAKIIDLRDTEKVLSADAANKLIADANSERDKTIAAAQEQHNKVVAEAKGQFKDLSNVIDTNTGSILSKWQQFTGSMSSMWHGFVTFMSSSHANASVSVSTGGTPMATARYGQPINGVGWHAKGGVFDGASVIGVGEAGAEAVVPLTSARMKPFANAIAENFVAPKAHHNSPSEATTKSVVVEVPVILNGREIARASARHMDEELAMLRKKNNRARGVFG